MWRSGGAHTTSLSPLARDLDFINGVSFYCCQFIEALNILSLPVTFRRYTKLTIYSLAGTGQSSNDERSRPPTLASPGWIPLAVIYIYTSFCSTGSSSVESTPVKMYLVSSPFRFAGKPSPKSIYISTKIIREPRVACYLFFFSHIYTSFLDFSISYLPKWYRNAILQLVRTHDNCGAKNTGVAGTRIRDFIRASCNWPRDDRRPHLNLCPTSVYSHGLQCCTRNGAARTWESFWIRAESPLKHLSLLISSWYSRCVELAFDLGDDETRDTRHEDVEDDVKLKWAEDGLEPARRLRRGRGKSTEEDDLRNCKSRGFARKYSHRVDWGVNLAGVSWNERDNGVVADPHPHPHPYPHPHPQPPLGFNAPA